MPLNNPMHILFVCWGNICRSPAAEATFRKLVHDQGLDEKITIDSAGTISTHQGNPPDSRMKSAARARNLSIEGSARKVNKQDFENADKIMKDGFLLGAHHGLDIEDIDRVCELLKKFK